MGSGRSVIVSFLLVLVFGPLGLLYSSVMWAILLTVTSIVLGAVLFPLIVFPYLAAFVVAIIAPIMNRGGR